MSISYRQDMISLLSIDDHARYLEFIPPLTCWWWTLSPTGEPAQAVSWDGLVDSDVGYFTDNYSAVRPVIYYSTIKTRIIQSPYDADKFYFNDHVFRVIDRQNEIAIAEIPISFDFFDYSSRDYESSSIRQKLNYWFETGIWLYNLGIDEHWWLE